MPTITGSVEDREQIREPLCPLRDLYRFEQVRGVGQLLHRRRHFRKPVTRQARRPRGAAQVLLCLLKTPKAAKSLTFW